LSLVEEVVEELVLLHLLVEQVVEVVVLEQDVYKFVEQQHIQLRLELEVLEVQREVDQEQVMLL
jgi:hypothetical protein